MQNALSVGNADSSTHFHIGDDVNLIPAAGYESKQIRRYQIRMGRNQYKHAWQNFTTCMRHEFETRSHPPVLEYSVHDARDWH